MQVFSGEKPSLFFFRLCVFVRISQGNRRERNASNGVTSRVRVLGRFPSMTYPAAGQVRTYSRIPARMAYLEITRGRIPELDPHTSVGTRVPSGCPQQGIYTSMTQATGLIHGSCIEYTPYSTHP